MYDDDDIDEFFDDTVIPFGKYKGTELKYIPASYLLWAYSEEGVMRKWPALQEYIASNLEEITHRADDEEEEDRYDY